MRYVYLGTKQTDPELKGAPCEPVRRPDGRCVRGRGNALVLFAGESSPRVVSARRLRVVSHMFRWEYHAGSGLAGNWSVHLVVEGDERTISPSDRRWVNQLIRMILAHGGRRVA